MNVAYTHRHGVLVPCSVANLSPLCVLVLQTPVRARLHLNGGGCAICAQLIEAFKKATTSIDKAQILEQRLAHRNYWQGQRCNWERIVQESGLRSDVHTCTADGYDKSKTSFPLYGLVRPENLDGWLEPWVIKIQVTVFQFYFRQFAVTPPWLTGGGNFAVTTLAHGIATFVDKIGTFTRSVKSIMLPTLVTLLFVAGPIS